MIAAQAVSAAPWALLFHGLITTLGGVWCARPFIWLTAPVASQGRAEERVITPSPLRAVRAPVALALGRGK
jgi:hypothetical protein